MKKLKRGSGKNKFCLVSFLENQKRGVKQLLVRAAVFFGLVYFIIPFLIDKIVHLLNLARLASFNYMHITLFSIALVLVFVIFNRKQLWEIKSYKQHKRQTFVFGILSLALMFFYFVISYLPFSYAFQHNYAGIIAMYVVYFAGIVCIALSVFNLDFFKRFKKNLVGLFSAMILFFAAILILRAAWRFFSGLIARIVYFLISLNFPDTAMAAGQGDPTLAISNFSVVIGSPCSGIDSLSMFAALFLLILVFDWKVINRKKAAWLFPVGLVGVFLMSILRVYLLMIVGVYNPELSLNLFHTNAGWILFVVYFLVFFYFAYPYMKK